MLKDIDTFIKEHHHINYCEAIIHRNGLIEYATPSHVEALIRITGESRIVINEKMPIFDSPIIWLVDYTKCIAVYTNGYIVPKDITAEQANSLAKLISSNLVENNKFMI